MLSYSVVSDSLQPRGLRSLSDSAACEILQARILEGCHFLLQGIFPTQGLNPRPQWFKHLCVCVCERERERDRERLHTLSGKWGE